MAGSYTYPNVVGDPDGQDVLKNRFDIRSAAQLREAEYALSALRQTELFEGHGPIGSFNIDHLKAIHHHIFQDVYEWAGHARNERPLVEGERVEPIGTISKGGHSFLPGSRINNGLSAALSPIGNPADLRGSSLDNFAAKVGRVLGELNYVHPFREGNGRTQEAFVQQLGAYVGHSVDFTVITKPRMIDASIATFNDPHALAMVHLMQDALDPARQDALRSAFAELRAQGENPMEHDVRTARIGQEVTGTVLGVNDRTATLVTDAGIIAVPRRDLIGEIPRDDREITVQVRSKFDVPAGTVEKTIEAAPIFIEPVTVWPYTVEQSVKRTVDAHPSVNAFLQDAQLHAGHIWKDPELVISRLRDEVAQSPTTVFPIIASLSRDPQSYGELLGGRTLFFKPDDERQKALDRIPVFTSSIGHFFETAHRLEPSVRQAEVDWRVQMASPMPSLSPEATAVVQDLAQAHKMKSRGKEPAHIIAIGALGRTQAWTEVKDWRQAMEARLSVPNAIERIPGLSEEKRTAIKSVLSAVDTAVREAYLTAGREHDRARTQERSLDKGRDTGMGY